MAADVCSVRHYSRGVFYLMPASTVSCWSIPALHNFCFKPLGFSAAMKFKTEL